MSCPRHLPCLIFDGFIKEYETNDTFGVLVVRLPFLNSSQASFKGNATIFFGNLKCSLQKVALLTNNDDQEMRNEKNKIKSDTSEEIILHCNITVFSLKNSSTHRMKAIFISRNHFSKGCSSSCKVYNSIIYEKTLGKCHRFRKLCVKKITLCY